MMKKVILVLTLFIALFITIFTFDLANLEGITEIKEKLKKDL